jgi:peptidoglycan hydrolase-like protein with peptidoglycan-binding domain
MAQYFELEGLDLAWIWNVSAAVSPRAYSHRPDVMLVQHAINTLLAPLHLKDERGTVITAYLVRDGYLGPKTNTAIAAYQRNLKGRGLLVKADGSVEPSSRDGWVRDGSAQYTIVYLNRDHVKVHGKMMDEADFPALLRTDLLVHGRRP